MDNERIDGQKSRWLYGRTDYYVRETQFETNPYKDYKVSHGSAFILKANGQTSYEILPSFCLAVLNNTTDNSPSSPLFWCQAVNKYNVSGL